MTRLGGHGVKCTNVAPSGLERLFRDGASAPIMQMICVQKHHQRLRGASDWR